MQVMSVIIMSDNVHRISRLWYLSCISFDGGRLKTDPGKRPRQVVEVMVP